LFHHICFLSLYFCTYLQVSIRQLRCQRIARLIAISGLFELTPRDEYDGYMSVSAVCSKHEKLRRPASYILLAGIGVAGLRLAGCASGEAKGTVTCPTGKSVEGVWIDADTGQGWAQWHPKSPQSRNIATYNRNVGEPTHYSVHVGCGGTPDNWEQADYAQKPPATTDVMVTWHCGPNPAQPSAIHGTCVLVGEE
jgi:hypothetical protein